jgi:spore coat polysaccharide biosynthesis protein SpsF
VERLREQGILIVVVDDPGERRLAADLAFYPPVPQVQRLNWNGFTGQLFVGWEWIMLRREFADHQSRVPNKRPVVLVTMGGTDPNGLTLKVVEALDLLQEDFQSIILLGPGFSHSDALKALLVTARRRFDVRDNVANISCLMAQADLAVASFGVTAYELAAMGVPAVYLCLTDDHAESASALEEAAIAKSFGEYSHVSSAALAQTVQSLLCDSDLRAEMSSRASALVDGSGAGRVANQIVMRVSQ